VAVGLGAGVSSLPEFGEDMTLARRLGAMVGHPLRREATIHIHYDLVRRRRSPQRPGGHVVIQGMGVRKALDGCHGAGFVVARRIARGCCRRHCVQAEAGRRRDIGIRRLWVHGGVEMKGLVGKRRGRGDGRDGGRRAENAVLGRQRAVLVFGGASVGDAALLELGTGAAREALVLVRVVAGDVARVEYGDGEAAGRDGGRFRLPSRPEQHGVPA